MVILDNCFGVKREDTERILKLNIPIKNQNSRNEYGMGIKTSGFWLGDKIIITSKHFNENKTIKITLDLNDLEKIEKNNNKVPVDLLSSNYFREENNFEWGTRIDICNVEKFKFTVNNLNKIAKKFSSKYREDFRKDKLEMRIVLLDEKGYWHDCFLEEQIQNIEQAKKLEFKEPILKKDDNNNEIKNYIEKTFLFEGKEYKIKGWIGVLECGSRSQPGLTLFRRGRTIKGDDSENQYKPKEIYGDSGSFAYQRITGWLHLDNFPVTQQKNDFAWTGGLEEEFIKIIKFEIEDGKYNLKKIANIAKNKESKIDAKELINERIANELKESLVEDKFFKNIDLIIDNKNNEDFFKFILNDGKYKFILNLKLTENSNENSNKWLYFSNKKDNEWNGMLNFSLPWFSPFNNDLPNIKDQIIKFAVYFSYAEWIHSKKKCTIAYDIRDTLNKCFSNENSLEEIK